MMCAPVYRVKRFNFSNIRIKIRIRRMQILINSVTSLHTCHMCSLLAFLYITCMHMYIWLD